MSRFSTYQPPFHPPLHQTFPFPTSSIFPVPYFINFSASPPHLLHRSSLTVLATHNTNQNQNSSITLTPAALEHHLGTCPCPSTPRPLHVQLIPSYIRYPQAPTPHSPTSPIHPFKPSGPTRAHKQPRYATSPDRYPDVVNMPVTKLTTQEFTARTCSTSPHPIHPTPHSSQDLSTHISFPCQRTSRPKSP